jgi:hypothetical protein
MLCREAAVFVGGLSGSSGAGRDKKKGKTAAEKKKKKDEA